MARHEAAPKKQPRNRPALIAGAIILGSGVLSLVLSRYPSPEGAASIGAHPRGGMTAAGIPSRRESAPPSPAAPAGALNLDDFMGLLQQAAMTPEVAPVAAKFAKDFTASPALKAVYDDFKERGKKGKPVPAAEFFAAVRAMPEFQRIVSQFAQQAGATSAVLTLTTFPGLKSVLKDLYQSQGASAPALKFRDRKELEREWAKKAQSGGGAAALQGPRSGGSRSDPAASVSGGGPEAIGSNSYASSAGAPRPSEAPEPEEGGARSGPRRSGEGVPAQGTSKPSAEALDNALREWLNKYGLDPNAYLGELDSGLWDLCIKRGELRDCYRACDDPPKLDSSVAGKACTLPSGTHPFWSACLQVPFSESVCLRECAKQSPPCVSDPAVVERVCDAPRREGRSVDPNCPGGAGRTTPCTPTPDVATDCVTWEKLNDASKKIFRTFWRDRLSETEIQRRYVWEHEQNLLDKDWRDKPISEGGYGPNWKTNGISQAARSRTEERRMADRAR